MDDIEVDDGSGRVQRACDSCRSRKIRCNRQSPCSNCRASKLTCKTTAQTQKSQRQRVHISEEYEKKIDRIEDRLAGIENVLEHLATKLGNLDIYRDSAMSGTHSKSSKSGKGPHSSSDANTASTPAPFEGETAINSQSQFAQQLLENAVGNTPSIEHNAEVKAALSSLQDIVSRREQSASIEAEPHPFFNKSFSEIDCSRLERPPWVKVDEVLERASTSPTMSFAIVFPFFKFREMKDMIKATFDAPQEQPVLRRILVFGICYQLFTEFSSYPIHGNRVESYHGYATACYRQMENAMGQMSMFIPATQENVMALLMASAYAIEACRPSLCGIFISKAGTICQDLGYHRVQTMKNDSDEDRVTKLHVFWFIYMMDRLLSLRLGRAPTIQDYDISLPYLAFNPLSPLDFLPKGTEMLVYWIKIAQVQGQTYERLFSPAAFLKSPEERGQIATELVDTLNQIWADRGGASVLDFAFRGSSIKDEISKGSSSGSNPPPQAYPSPSQYSSAKPESSEPYTEGSFSAIGDLFFHADIVLLYSTISLIQKAVSSDNMTFNAQCVETSRAALLAHRRASEQFNIKGSEKMFTGYVAWSVLQAPFTPFIVIFCNAIVHCDRADLESLYEFVVSLEPCRPISEGADRLHRMCNLFLQVAKLYVEAKTRDVSSSSYSHHQSQYNQQTPAGNEFYEPHDPNHPLGYNTISQLDPYLSALGLFPTNSEWLTAGFAQGVPGIDNMQGFGQEHQSSGFDTSAGGDLSNMGVPDRFNANGNAMQDWFSGSRYLMGLMEDENMPDLGI